jgi:phenylpropionate dioxygenase-like ring-hydroxylating dioxygenase large terminal subunit
LTLACAKILATNLMALSETEMERTLKEILASYNDAAPLSEAYTIPAAWYTDARVAGLERENVFARTWQVVGRTDQLRRHGQYVTATVASEPIVVVRGSDNKLRAFFNVCRHHAMTVMNEPCGEAQHLRCPYHGWTYNLEGELRGMTEFEGVCNFDRAQNGLVPVRVETWDRFVFVNLDPQAAPLETFLGALVERAKPLGFSELKFVERRSYTQNCNWKVYVDNFLDGGYHVPHMHKGLNSVLDYKNYTIENVDRLCIQSSPVTVDSDSEASAAATRKGNCAFYFWQYPNFMLNWYEGYLDTNLVIPLGVDRCEVIFDFYFGNTDPTQMPYIRESISVSERVQQEDIVICDGVQRGLSSRAYQAGRLSVRREAGEHLFHRLLAADLKDTRAAAAR